MSSDHVPEHEWERGWEGHERSQRRRLSKLPLSQKLQWLEEAQQVIENLRRSKRESGKDESSR